MKNWLPPSVLLGLMFATSVAVAQCPQSCSGISPLIVSPSNASNFGCGDGSVLIEETDPDCEFQVIITEINSGTQVFDYYTDYYPYNGSGNRETQVGGLAAGDYQIACSRSYLDVDNNLVTCTTYDNFHIGPDACSLSTSFNYVSPGIPSSCSNGVIRLNASNNDCAGYWVELYTLDGLFINFGVYTNAEIAEFTNLIAGTYVLHTYTNSYNGSPVCEAWDTVSIPDLGCVSPFTLQSAAVSNVVCSDGSVTATMATAGCDWNVLFFRASNNAILYSVNTGSFALNGLNQPEFVFSGLAPGVYYLNSTSTTFNYNYDPISCNVWDTVVVSAPADPPLTWYQDSDGDGHGNASVSVQACSAPSGYVASSDDCDDADPTAYPGAVEVIGNATDEDCNGIAEGFGCPAPVVVCQPDISINATTNCGATIVLPKPGTGNIVLNILNGTGNKYFYISNLNISSLRQQFTDYNFVDSRLIAVTASPGGRVPYHFGGRQRIGVNNGATGSDDLINGNDELHLSIGSLIAGRKFTGANLNLNAGSTGASALVEFWDGNLMVGSSSVTLAANAIQLVTFTSPAPATRITLKALSGSYGIKGFTNSVLQLTDSAAFTSCSAIVSISGNTAANNFYPIGTHTINWVVNDASGNTTTCSQVITVNGTVQNTPASNVAYHTSGSLLGAPVPGAPQNAVYLGIGYQSLLLSVTPSGGTSFTYRWRGSALSGTGSSRVFSPVSAGNYVVSCEITNNVGCKQTVTFNLCVVRAVTNTGLINLCNGTSNLQLSLTAAVDYLFANPGSRPGTCSTSCGTLPRIEAEEESADQLPVGLELQLKVYPNPSSDMFYFEWNAPVEEPVSIQVSDATGRMVYQSTVEHFEGFKIDAASWSPGIYTAQIANHHTKKIVQLSKSN